MEECLKDKKSNKKLVRFEGGKREALEALVIRNSQVQGGGVTCTIRSPLAHYGDTSDRMLRSLLGASEAESWG